MYEPNKGDYRLLSFSLLRRNNPSGIPLTRSVFAPGPIGRELLPHRILSGQVVLIDQWHHCTGERSPRSFDGGDLSGIPAEQRAKFGIGYVPDLSDR